MALAELRERHPRFVYDSYKINQAGSALNVRFQFILEPNVVFNPEVVLPVARPLEQQALENFVFHLGLIEAISYWKAACPQELIVEAGRLTDQQVAWWHDLFIHGLGEFFYRNRVDFTPADFLHITTNQQKEASSARQFPSSSGDLILVGGGKDSTITLETLKDSPHHKGTLMLNPTRAALDSAMIAGYQDPLIVRRTIDSKLPELNKLGYLNGHTPFSAYLAFLGVFVGALHDYKNIIVSNERSAGEGNITFHGLEVNHQYSKSYRFERLFREYCTKYLTSDIQYFSFLRPLYDLQISSLFAQYPDQHLSFRSCNVNQRKDSWCGACAKCAFVYLSLFPFISLEKMVNIFGEDYFAKPQIQRFIRELVGLGAHKPFECVGTEEESKLAIALCIKQYRSSGKVVPPFLLSLEKELGVTDNALVQMLEERVSNKWGEEHFLPPEYTAILKKVMANTD